MNGLEARSEKESPLRKLDTFSREAHKGPVEIQLVEECISVAQSMIEHLRDSKDPIAKNVLDNLADPNNGPLRYLQDYRDCRGNNVTSHEKANRLLCVSKMATIKSSVLLERIIRKNP